MYPLVYFHFTKKLVVIFNTRNGTKLQIRTDRRSTDIHVFTEIWLENVYLREFEFEFGNEISIIDIGAHIGLFTLLVSSLFKNSKILCFEPDTSNYQMLLQNLMINNKKNIHSYNTAISSTSGKKKFYISDKDFAAHSIYKKSNNVIEVESNTMEEIFRKSAIERCALLKMDCEGAEYEILLNMTDEQFDKIEKICIEYETFNGFVINDIITKLKNHNFRTWIKPRTNKVGFLYAQKV